MEVACPQKCEAIAQCECGSFLCTHIIPSHIAKEHNIGPISQTEYTKRGLGWVAQKKLEILQLSECVIFGVEKATSEQLSKVEEVRSKILRGESKGEELRSMDFKRCLKRVMGSQDLVLQKLRSKLHCLVEEVKKRRVELSEVENIQQELEKAQEQAQEELEEALKNSKKEKADCLGKVGVIYATIGKYGNDLKCQIESLETRKQVVVDENDLAKSYNDLGMAYCRMGKNKEAEKYCLKSLKIKESVLGPQDPSLALSYNDLGLVYRNKEDYKKAEKCLLKSLEIRKAVLDPQHADISESYNNLGIIYNSLKDYRKAEEYLLKALKIDEAVLDPQSIDLAWMYNDLGSLYKSLKDYQAAEEYLLKALKIEEAVLDPQSIYLAWTYYKLGSLYKSLKDYQAAEEYLLKALKIEEAVLDPQDPELALTYKSLKRLQKKPKKHRCY